ncbi:hypothetical protein KEJ39_01425 [Candidatus Bathyarchaeota archaeon]|nr:hypothetical protein [Candidatus Bathyarchaeota archaeon]
MIREVSTNAEARPSFKIIRKDPKDDVLLMTAYEGKPDYIASGDRHLQDLKSFKGIKAASRRQMMKIITRRLRVHNLLMQFSALPNRNLSQDSL